MAQEPVPQPQPNVAVVDPDSRFSLAWRQYFPKLDAAVRGLFGFFSAATFATPTAPGTLIAAVDDAAAAAAGVPIGGFYRAPTTGTPPHTNSALQIRVT